MNSKYMPTIQYGTDNLYLNVTFDHLASDGNAGTKAIYQVTKDEAILDNPSEWYGSIIRFDLPLSSIPLLIYPVIPNSGLAQTAPMIIGVTVGAVDFSTNLVYVPNNTLPPVNQNNPNQQIISQFYYVYTYQNIINSFNVALNASFVAAGSPGGTVPFFYYDPVTQLINLVVPQTFITAGATIYWNQDSNNFLDGFHTSLVSLTAVNGHHYTMIFDTTNDKAYPTAAAYPGAVATWKFVSEYSTLEYWGSLRKIIVTTSGIPITYEHISITTTGGIQSGQAASIPIFTDYIPIVEMAGDTRSIAYYVPSGQYRLADLNGNVPLRQIDLTVYWQDRFNNLAPLYILPMQQGSMKIGFFKKSLYKCSNLLLK